MNSSTSSMSTSITLRPRREPTDGDGAPPDPAGANCGRPMIAAALGAARPSACEVLPRRRAARAGSFDGWLLFLYTQRRNGASGAGLSHDMSVFMRQSRGLEVSRAAWRSLAVVVCASVLSCAAQPSVPTVVADRPQLPSCGEEQLDSPQARRNREARTCFFRSAMDGRPAEFRSWLNASGRKSMSEIYRVLGVRRIEVFVDGTEDPQGSGRWERYTCDRLTPVAELYDPPDTVYAVEEVFVTTREHCTAPEPIE